MSDLPPQQESLPIFTEAQRRADLQPNDRIFFATPSGEILIAKVRESGLTPTCDFPNPASTSGYVGYLKPGMIWSRTEEEVRARLEEQRSVAAESTTEMVPQGPGSEIAMITLAQRLELQRQVGAPIVSNESGGIDLRDLDATAADLTIRIAHPISAFGVTSMEQLVAEGFINSTLYRVLRQEFKELFDQLKSLYAASEALKTLPANVVDTMNQALNISARGLVSQFLQKHAELIQFTQLATVTNGDFAARALLAIATEPGKGRKDLPPAAADLMEQFRVR